MSQPFEPREFSYFQVKFGKLAGCCYYNNDDQKVVKPFNLLTRKEIEQSSEDHLGVAKLHEVCFHSDEKQLVWFVFFSTHKIIIHSSKRGTSFFRFNCAYSIVESYLCYSRESKLSGQHEWRKSRCSL